MKYLELLETVSVGISAAEDDGVLRSVLATKDRAETRVSSLETTLRFHKGDVVRAQEYHTLLSLTFAVAKVRRLVRRPVFLSSLPN
jgi:hypothetical protein